MEGKHLPSGGAALTLDGDKRPSAKGIAALQRPRQAFFRAHIANFAIGAKHVNPRHFGVSPMGLPIGNVGARRGLKDKKIFDNRKMTKHGLRLAKEVKSGN